MSKHLLEKPSHFDAPAKPVSFVSSQNLTPWLFVPAWYLVRVIASDTEYADLPLTGSLVGPLFWELVWLSTVAGIVGVAKLLAWFARHPAARVVIALGTYLAIPYAVVFLKTLLAPLPPGETYYNQFPESLVLSLGVGIITVMWASPLSTLKKLEWGLDDATNKLVALRASVLDVTLRAQRDLTKQLELVVAPEIEKVITILSRAGLSNTRKSELSAQINASVTDVLRPFSQRLIDETSVASSDSREPASPTPRRLRLGEPISVRNAFLPLLVGSIPAVWLFSRSARELTPSWPESWYWIALCVTLVLLVLASGVGIKALIPRSFRVHPLLAFLAITPVNVALAYLPLLVLENFPPDLGNYASWGLLATFPEIGIIPAATCPLVTIGGILLAREFDVIERKKQVQTDVAQETAALATELWHLRRQTGLMVHGPVQSALISTGLRFGSMPVSKQQATELVGVLEKTLTDLKLDNRPLSLPGFLSSLQDLWESVATLHIYAQEAALKILDTSPASLHACSEVIREGVNNAIFHGMATEINISVVMLNETSVHIRVEDNGVGPTSSPTPGMGSDLISTVSSGWNLWRLGEKTVLTANLFIPGPVRSGTTRH